MLSMDPEYTIDLDGDVSINKSDGMRYSLAFNVTSKNSVKAR